MTIDINELTVDELCELNARVCARIDELRDKQDRARLAMLRPGMTVQFTSEHETITGVLLKKNRKTVIVQANDQCQFKVPAGIVRPVHATNTKLEKAVKHALK